MYIKIILRYGVYTHEGENVANTHEVDIAGGKLKLSMESDDHGHVTITLFGSDGKSWAIISEGSNQHHALNQAALFVEDLVDAIDTLRVFANHDESSYEGQLSQPEGGV